MKKRLPLIMLLAMLVSCNTDSSLPSSEASENTSYTATTNDDTSNEEVTSESTTKTSDDPSSSDSQSTTTTSEPPSSSTNSSESSASSEEEEDEVLTDISAIKAIAATFDESSVNNRGVYTSTIQAEITAQLLTLQDYGTTKAGYNGRYKAFVANETGFITVNLSDAGYTNMRNYKQEQQVYTFSGVIGLYNDEVEIDMGISAEPTFHSGVTLDYDYKAFVTDATTISELRTTVLANDFKFNVKGTGWKQAIYRIDLQYVKDIVNETLLFSDGENVIEVHGHDKIKNGLTQGKTYTVYGRVGLYNFRPELEHIAITPSGENIALSYENVPKITATNIFTYSFANDDDYLLAKNKNYAGIVNNVYYFEGYLNWYEKAGKYYLLLEDTFSESTRTSETTAFAAKSLSIKNEDSRNLYENQLDFSPFGEFTDGGKFGVYITPHEYSKVAWSVFVLTAPIPLD